MFITPRSLLSLLLAVVPALSLRAGAEPTAPAAQPAVQTPADKWARVNEQGDLLQLEIAVREFRSAAHPDQTLTVAGAVHIADRPFYQALHDILDPLDLVLFEGVLPAGAGSSTPDMLLDDRARADRTRHRIRLLAVLLERQKKLTGDYPASLDDLRAALGDNKRAATWLKIVDRDAWGRPFGYTVGRTTVTETVDGQSKVISETPSYDLRSFGSDGIEGGEGHAADISARAILSDDPLSPAETGADPGLQKRLARAFRLTFQLDEMDTDKPNYLNADMSADEIEERLADADADGSILFSLLDGSGFQAQMVAAVLGIIERMPGAANRGKLMMIEMLARADTDLMAAGMPGGEGLLKVIIDDRNQVVLDRLAEALRQPNPPARIGILYGAGHMPDLIERLEDQLGFTQTAEHWIPAVTLDLAKAGIPRSEVVMTRAMLLRQLAQIRQRAAAEQPAP